MPFINFQSRNPVSIIDKKNQGFIETYCKNLHLSNIAIQNYIKSRPKRSCWMSLAQITSTLFPLFYFSESRQITNAFVMVPDLEKQAIEKNLWLLLGNVQRASFHLAAMVNWLELIKSFKTWTVVSPSLDVIVSPCGSILSRFRKALRLRKNGKWDWERKRRRYRDRDTMNPTM